MFSALKKLAAGNSKNEANGKTPTGGQQAMHASLQKKFAKGVHYNSKIVHFCFHKMILSLIQYIFSEDNYTRGQKCR
jgi:hypothetical protein